MPFGLPAERLAAMQKVFADISRDKAFLADTAMRSVEVQYVGSKEVAALVKRVLATPKPVLERTHNAFGIKAKK